MTLGASFFLSSVYPLAFSSRTMSPPSISMTRCFILSTRLLSCVQMMTVVLLPDVLPFLLISRSIAMMLSDVSGSRLPVGSSATISLGLFTIALAMATLCCSPPESSCGYAFALSFNPTADRQMLTVFARLFGGTPTISPAKATFSATVFVSIRRKSW